MTNLALDKFGICQKCACYTQLEDYEDGIGGWLRICKSCADRTFRARQPNKGEE